MILTDTQKVTCTINPLNSKGKPAPVDGVPLWESSDPQVALVVRGEDGKTAIVYAIAEGTAQISVTADADMDVNEVRNIAGVLDIEVRPSEAVTMGIQTGAPEEQGPGELPPAPEPTLRAGRSKK
jgi:hypothetical protein